MKKNLRFKFLVILGSILASIYFTFPLEKRINLGLDLRGGMHLILRVENEKLEPKAKNDSVLKAIEILRNRIDSLGVGETVIQRQGENQILVQLPGVTDRAKAMEMIGRVAQLEFRVVSDDPIKFKDAIAGNVATGFVLKKIIKENDEPILLEDKVALSGETVSDAIVDFDSTGFGAPQISLTFSSEGANQFAQVTKDNVGKRLAILLDGEVLSAPRINEAILGGRAQITGQFTFEEASLLSLALRSGALPAPMHVEEERTIGPLLGQDSIKAGINATIIGGVAVFVFMAFYYLLSGVIANIALAINLLIILGMMGLLNALMPGTQVTLTLPGIAGIILSLGMAVDANVLINERIREEQENGKPLSMAIQAGFNKAFSAIFDSHITSLIASFVLYQFGAGPIKGFAVTLAIGVITSLFTAITVTKFILEVLIHSGKIKKLSMLHIFKSPNFDFISKRKVAYFISIVMVIICIGTLIVKKDSAYGIDFSGGQIQEYKFAKPVSADLLRQYLKEAKVTDVVIQQFEKNPQVVMLRTSDDTFNQVTEVFKLRMQDNSFELMRVEKVGPVVSQALRKQAFLALVFALVGILIYVGFRFKHFDFAAAGVIALLHDVIIAMGGILLLGRQIDLLVVTALLTIAGYSINDTIVTYDRVRENIAKGKKLTMAEVLNISINQTLGRTVLTSMVTLLTVISLFFFGGEVLNTFALCLLIGFGTGVYSTIFIASPLVLLWQKNK